MLIPHESSDSVQSLIFILQFKLNQQKSEIIKMPLWEATKRVSQIEEYYTMLFQGLGKALKGAKGGQGKIPAS